MRILKMHSLYTQFHFNNIKVLKEVTTAWTLTTTYIQGFQSTLNINNCISLESHMSLLLFMSHSLQK